MIVDGYNFDPIQLPQSLQTLQPEASVGASPENIEQNQKCVKHFHNLLPNPPHQIFINGCVFFRLSNIKLIYANQFELLIERQDNPNYYHYKTIIISIYCREKPTNQYLCAGTEKVFKDFPADFYVSYCPSTLTPQGFAMRNQLDLNHNVRHRYKPGKQIWNTELENLDTNINKLFDLHYLWHNSQLNYYQFQVVFV